MNTNTLQNMLATELTPVLWDMAGAQYILADLFAAGGVRDVLEVGVSRLDTTAPEQQQAVYGQSTKILMLLTTFYGCNRYVSVDVWDCLNTVNACHEWLEKRGVNTGVHEFVIAESLKFAVGQYFPDGLDLLFLDTNHDWTVPKGWGYVGGAGYTYRELEHFAPHMRVGGRVLLHDTLNDYEPKAYGVNVGGAAWRFIEEHRGWTYQEHCPNGRGLGELRRVS